MAQPYNYTEDSYEQAVLDLFRDMGYEVMHGPEVDAATGRELTDATIPGKLREAMLRINGYPQNPRAVFSAAHPGQRAAHRLDAKRPRREFQDRRGDAA